MTKGLPTALGSKTQQVKGKTQRAGGKGDQTLQPPARSWDMPLPYPTLPTEVEVLLSGSLTMSSMSVSPLN